ncbi:hypothetical protein FB451DRAFT_719350 [Mycena latifolia]|nr:hypothetical protein FB451DRAFT_719350 [Mycena latifolia]
MGSPTYHLESPTIQGGQGGSGGNGGNGGPGGNGEGVFLGPYVHIEKFECRCPHSIFPDTSLRHDLCNTSRPGNFPVFRGPNYFRAFSNPLGSLDLSEGDFLLHRDSFKWLEVGPAKKYPTPDPETEDRPLDFRESESTFRAMGVNPREHGMQFIIFAVRNFHAYFKVFKPQGANPNLEIAAGKHFVVEFLPQFVAIHKEFELRGLINLHN